MSRTCNITTGNRCTLAMLVLSLILSACQSNPYQWSETSARAIEQDLNATRQPVQAGVPPADVQQALLPPFPESGSGRPAAVAEARFDLAVNNAPASQVFMGLVENTPYGMVIHPDVTEIGRASCRERV